MTKQSHPFIHSFLEQYNIENSIAHLGHSVKSKKLVRIPIGYKNVSRETKKSQMKLAEQIAMKIVHIQFIFYTKYCFLIVFSFINGKRYHINRKTIFGGGVSGAERKSDL